MPALLSRWFSKLPQVGYVNSLEGTLTAAMYFLLSVIFHLLPSFLHNIPLTGRIPLTKTKALDLKKSLHCTFNTKRKKNGFFTPKNFHDFAGFHLALSRISSLVSTVLAGFQQKPTLLPSLQRVCEASPYHYPSPHRKSWHTNQMCWISWHKFNTSPFGVPTIFSSNFCYKIRKVSFPMQPCSRSRLDSFKKPPCKGIFIKWYQNGYLQGVPKGDTPKN